MAFNEFELLRTYMFNEQSVTDSSSLGLYAHYGCSIYSLYKLTVRETQSFLIGRKLFK